MTSPSSFPSPSPSGSSFSDYTHSGRASTGGGGVTSGEGYWSIEKCKKAYSQYIANKSQEIEEQKNARRYYHGVHWTSEQVRELNKESSRSSPSTASRASSTAWLGRSTGSSKIRRRIRARRRTRTRQSWARRSFATRLIARTGMRSRRRWRWIARSRDFPASRSGLKKSKETSAQSPAVQQFPNTVDRGAQLNGNSPTGGAAPSYKDDTTQGGVGGGGSTTPRQAASIK